MSAKLNQLGEKDDAVFWFYAGQLRFRYVLAIDPSETGGQVLGSMPDCWASTSLGGATFISHRK